MVIFHNKIPHWWFLPRSVWNMVKVYAPYWGLGSKSAAVSLFTLCSLTYLRPNQSLSETTEFSWLNDYPNQQPCAIVMIPKLDRQLSVRDYIQCLYSLQFHLLHVIPRESPKLFCPFWGTNKPAVITLLHDADKISFLQLQLIVILWHVTVQSLEDSTAETARLRAAAVGQGLRKWVNVVIILDVK